MSVVNLLSKRKAKDLIILKLKSYLLRRLFIIFSGTSEQAGPGHSRINSRNLKENGILPLGIEGRESENVSYGL